jgi:hypothetical protein
VTSGGEEFSGDIFPAISFRRYLSDDIFPTISFRRYLSDDIYGFDLFSRSLNFSLNCRGALMTIALLDFLPQVRPNSRGLRTPATLREKFA